MSKQKEKALKQTIAMIFTYLWVSLDWKFKWIWLDKFEL